MKIIQLLFLLLPIVSFSQIPNCVPVRADYLWMSKTEVSNAEYTLFLSQIAEEDSLENTPNSLLWSERKFTAPLQKYYFRHPAYRNYPVVNITFEQALQYCSWLTDVLNKNYPKQKVRVRLPTEKEWEDAARGGNQFAIYPWGTETMRVESGKNQGKLQANFIRGKGDLMGIAGSLNDAASITAPVESYWPNDFGLYCMSGNVSEMVLVKGIVKGGSWANRADWLRIDKQQFISSASPEVGFRYVVEILNFSENNTKTNSDELNKKFFKNYFSIINDTLSVGRFEVTNELFSLFRKEVANNSFIHSLPVADSCWDNLFPYARIWSQNYSMTKKFENYPVVNIALWQAEQFCNWFEQKYEWVMQEKIEIRLPTEDEWKLAARGGLGSSPYPWGGPYIRNSKGSFLANHNPKMSESENVYGYDTLSLSNFFDSYFTDLHDFDGEAVLAPVNSYFPNEFGLYNVAGNAAEMIRDSDYTKGGSWKSTSYFLQIESREKWDKQPNPFTGFRVFLIQKK